MSAPAVCLSLVPVLRCMGLTRLESGLLLIPPVLEVMFSIGVLFAGRGQGRRRFVFALEGPMYLLLATLDVLAHEVSTFNRSLTAFKILDIIIGAASFIPILLFTGFLYLFKRTEFFPAFPNRFTFVANLFAILVIPFLLITNEIGSFIGNNYDLIQFPTIPPTPAQFAIGSHNQSVDTARLFFSSFALALMAAYEVVTFLVFFVRLSTSLVDQRRIEDAGGIQDETYLFKGTGWFALGLTLCAAESFAGFASGNFGLFFTRRLLRMLGRACVAIGVVKGPDRRLQFDMLDGEKRKSKRQSTMRLRIGAPLLIDSTRRISQILGIDLTRRRTSMQSMQSETAVGTAPLVGNATFPGRPSDDVLSRGVAFLSAQDFPLPPARRPAQFDMASVDSSRRVTVSLRRGRAPTLILRLSDTNLPSPGMFMARTHGQGARDDRTIPDDRTSTFSYTDPENAQDPHGAIQEVSMPEPEGEAHVQSSPVSLYSPGKSLIENFKTQAYPAGTSSPRSRVGLPSNPRSSPQNMIQPPPPMVVRERRASYLMRAGRVSPQHSSPEMPPLDTAFTADADTDPRPRGSEAPRRVLSKRKPALAERASMYLDRANFISPVTLGDSAPFPPIPDSATIRRAGLPGASPGGFGSPDSLNSTDWMPAVPRVRRPVTTLVDSAYAHRIAASMVDPARAHSLRRARTQSAEAVRPPSLAASPADRTLGRESSFNIDWIADPDMQAQDSEVEARQEAYRRQHARISSQVLRTPSIVRHASATRSPQVSRHVSGASRTDGAGGQETVRTVSVGAAPMRTTPLPTPAAETRASVNVERLESLGFVDPGAYADGEYESEDTRRQTNMSLSTSSSDYDSASIRRAVVQRVRGSAVSDAESVATGSTWTPQRGGGTALNATELANRYGEAF